MERLTIYAERLIRWNTRINLVGAASMADPWRRHMLDSAQLVDHLPARATELVDLGSGAGFPGLVLAIISGLRTHLIEADTRKAAFLREAVRLTGASATVHSIRIENLEPFPVDVITARALAPLPALLVYASPILVVSAEHSPICTARAVKPICRRLVNRRRTIKPSAYSGRPFTSWSICTKYRSM